MGTAFQATTVANAYRHRPPYPEEAVSHLIDLLGDGPRLVLDAGCGTGKLARALAARVDPSEAMLAVGQSLAGGDDSRIRWIHAAVEDAALSGPYGLIVAGASVHWFDLDVALPQLAEQLEPGAIFARVDGDGAYDAPWEATEVELFMDLGERRTGRRPNLRPASTAPVRILEHPLFIHQRTLSLEPFEFEQSVDDYIACQFSRASLSRETLGPELSERMDRELRALLEPHTTNRIVHYDVRFLLEWGSLS
jgi:SAM-dependent methyltransferase